jgi:hypothetical protein
MITKGVSDIRGIHSLNTRPGPITESSGLLKLYQLSAERDNLLKKLEWVKRQSDQAKRRLSEINHGMHTMKRVVEERSKREPTLDANPRSRNAFINY